MLVTFVFDNVSRKELITCLQRQGLTSKNQQRKKRYTSLQGQIDFLLDYFEKCDGVDDGILILTVSIPGSSFRVYILSHFTFKIPSNRLYQGISTFPKQMIPL